MRSEIARHRNRPRCRPIAIAQDVGPTIGIEGQLEVRLRVWFKVTRVMLKKIKVHRLGKTAQNRRVTPLHWADIESDYGPNDRE